MESADGSARLNAVPMTSGFQNKSVATLPKLSRTDDGHLTLTWKEQMWNESAVRYQRTWDGQVWSAAQSVP